MINLSHVKCHRTLLHESDLKHQSIASLELPAQQVTSQQIVETVIDS